MAKGCDYTQVSVESVAHYIKRNAAARLID
jgi:hypothetical protein